MLPKPTVRQRTIPSHTALIRLVLRKTFIDFSQAARPKGTAVIPFGILAFPA